MSDQKPQPHPMVKFWPNENGEKAHGLYVHNPVTDNAFVVSPDDAVALGFALFEHGLHLKGKMKPQKKD